MSYSVINDRTGAYMGHAGSVVGYDDMANAAGKFNSSKRGKGKIPHLIALFDTGKAEDPKAVARDISKVLKAGHLNKDTALGLEMLRESVLNARDDPIIVADA